MEDIPSISIVERAERSGVSGEVPLHPIYIICIFTPFPFEGQRALEQRCNQWCNQRCYARFQLNIRDAEVHIYIILVGRTGQ